MIQLASPSELALSGLGAGPAAEPAATAPTVAVYAERAIARASLAALLRGNAIEVVVPAEAEAAPSPLLPARTPDVVLLAGREADPDQTLQLVQEHLAPLLLLLDRPLSEDAWPALGARGAVCRECRPEQLIRAVRALAAGGSCFECHHLSEAEAEAPVSRLSARERHVAAELARGAQIEEIADKLCISPHTARTHVRNIRRKLGARTSAHAVAMAITLGMVALPTTV